MGKAMQVMAEEGQLLEFLVRLISARNALEIGTFTGYSALCIAKGLQEGGRLITCDINQKWHGVALPFWERAGVSGIIDYRSGDALLTLGDILSECGGDYMDFIFVDADKGQYPMYYELGLKILRPNGLMVIDNTLYSGRVADPASDDLETVAIRRLNETIYRDERVDISVLPMADGITLIQKRECN